MTTQQLILDGVAIKEAVSEVLNDGVHLTRDIGGVAFTATAANAVLDKLGI